VLFDIYTIVINTVSGILIGVLLLRFWMQAIRLRPPYNVGEFVYTLSDWLVKPMRRIIPGVGGLDWASLIAALLIAALAAFLQRVWFYDFDPIHLLKIALPTVLGAIYWGLMFLLLLMVAISWINPHAPIAPFVNALLNPLLRPFRRIIPPIGNIDFSAMVLMLVAYIVYFELMKLIWYL
jgi:YggT family protein